MSIKLEEYFGKMRIVSLARRKETLEDLNRSGLDVVYKNQNGITLYPEGIHYNLKDKDEFTFLNYEDYDVFELYTDGTLIRCFSVASTENFFFITPQCNSACIMCPSAAAVRKLHEVKNANWLIDIARHIPVTASHLTITGGEPFLAGLELFDFLAFLRAKFLNTEFLILTNGRIFSIWKYASALVMTAPAFTTIAIPIHGSTEKVHDFITQTPGSFIQTLTGIKNLLKLGAAVEVRIVVSRVNGEDLVNIAKLIIRDLAGISYVSVMAMEMTGSAAVNKSVLWEPYSKLFVKAEPAIKLLLENGIDVKLYNFPLCTVSSGYRTLCEKSISPGKIKYSPDCSLCAAKDACGGVFDGTYYLEREDLIPLK